VRATLLSTYRGNHSTENSARTILPYNHAARSSSNAAISPETKSAAVRTSPQPTNCPPPRSRNRSVDLTLAQRVPPTLLARADEVIE
jgi:hypothetical protein